MDTSPDGQATSSGRGDELRAAADDKDEGELWATATTAAGKQAAAVGPGRAAGDVGRQPSTDDCGRETSGGHRTRSSCRRWWPENSIGGDRIHLANRSIKKCKE